MTCSTWQKAFSRLISALLSPLTHFWKKCPTGPRRSHAQHLSTHRPGLGRRQRRPGRLVQAQGAQVSPRGLLDEGDRQTHDRKEVSQESEETERKSRRSGKMELTLCLERRTRRSRRPIPRQSWRIGTCLGSGHRRYLVESG